jgi:hypothetical protein
VLIYADDQILMATSEDELQTMAYRLNLIARKYKMTTSSTKTKSVAMCGNRIQRVKIVINDNIIERQQILNTWSTLYQNTQVFRRQIANIQQNKRRYMEIFWKTNEQRNKIKNSQHCS